MAAEGLHFQDFGGDSRVSDVRSNVDGDATTFHFDHTDSDKLIDDGEAEKSQAGAFWQFSFYRQYFDVDTDQVVRRLLNSFVPKRGANFIVDQIRPTPDLYGPFWVCATLVFATAIFSNIAQYIQSGGAVDAAWQYDFRAVTTAATVVASYVLVAPLLVVAFLWHSKCSVTYTYLELLSLYGYSMTIFVPVAMLWAIQVEAVHWLLILLAVCCSGAVILQSLWSALSSGASPLALPLAIGILALHAVLAVGFKEFFFGQVSGGMVEVAVSTIASITVAPSP